jgi:acyl-CoA synthetase (AMP-forming)/AMP-acid ligase II
LFDEKGREIPYRKQGGIIIRSHATIVGYFKDSERKAETKRDGWMDGWIYIGNIGYQNEDGYFFFVGRKKRVICRRGELISPR